MKKVILDTLSNMTILVTDYQTPWKIAFIEQKNGQSYVNIADHDGFVFMTMVPYLLALSFINFGNTLANEILS